MMREMTGLGIGFAPESWTVNVSLYPEEKAAIEKAGFSVSVLGSQVIAGLVRFNAIIQREAIRAL